MFFFDQGLARVPRSDDIASLITTAPLSTRSEWNHGSQRAEADPRQQP
jgi:hypothetical protein